MSCKCEKIVDTKRLDEIIAHLEGLKCHCQDFADVSDGEESIWVKDVKVLEETISILTNLKCDNKK